MQIKRKENRYDLSIENKPRIVKLRNLVTIAQWIAFLNWNFKKFEAFLVIINKSQQMKYLIAATLIAVASSLKVDEHETIFEFCSTDYDCQRKGYGFKWCFDTWPSKYCVECCRGPNDNCIRQHSCWWFIQILSFNSYLLQFNNPCSGCF